MSVLAACRTKAPASALLKNAPSPSRPFPQCSHSSEVLQNHSVRLRRRKYFSVRVIKFWNRPATSIITARPVLAFKRQPNSAWKKLYPKDLCFTPPSYLRCPYPRPFLYVNFTPSFSIFIPNNACIQHH